MSSNITTESGGPRFTILPPTTIQDDGSPSDSLKKDVTRLLRFIADERHLVAGELLENTKRRLQESSSISIAEAKTAEKARFFKNRLASASSKKQQLELKKDVQQASAILEANQAVIQLLEVRTKEQSLCFVWSTPFHSLFASYYLSCPL